MVSDDGGDIGDNYSYMYVNADGSGMGDDSERNGDICSNQQPTKFYLLILRV